MRFIVDLNVGRLTKWLRAMGFDSVFPGMRTTAAWSSVPSQRAGPS